MTLAMAERAGHWPDRTAIVADADGTEYTYSEFAQAVEEIANSLPALGVQPGDRIVTLSRNRVELLSLLFAALRRDATLAPVSHRLSPGTVATLVDRIAPELVVVEPAFEDRLTDVDVESVDFSDFDGGSPADTLDRDSDAPPLFLHTGGTTGTPKVVPISERQLEWNAITEVVAWGLDDETVSVVVLPMFHTGGWNLLTLPTLYAGGTVVLRPEFEPGEVLRCIEAYGATQMFAVPAIYRALADHPDFDDTDVSTIEWFMSGGGPCPREVMRPYLDRDETFVQGYGLTEGGPNNLYRSPDRDDAREKLDSVGRPFPDCEARIVDADGAPVEGSGTGELELSGPVTADGYLETEDGTFDGNWVSTGDVARRDEDGDYSIVGRTDNMFVSGGENVYPEAIEDVLESHDGVAAVGVVAIPHERWGEVPKAIVVGNISREELRAFCEAELADYEVPHEVEFVDALPETGAGKLDRGALEEAYGR